MVANGFTTQRNLKTICALLTTITVEGLISVSKSDQKSAFIYMITNERIKINQKYSQKNKINILMYISPLSPHARLFRALYAPSFVCCPLTNQKGP